MQILQVNLEDYIPKLQIFVKSDVEIQKPVLKWRSPSTLWAGQPVISFIAETDFEDRAEKVGFADFNPMWSFPTTSVNSNYENIAFGMDESHILKDPPHPPDCLFQGSHSSSKSWNHSQSNSSTVFGHKG